jgi:hypothetical protein
VEGIHLPPTVVQRGINSYILHTGYGEVQINTPAMERTIATVHRGCGQKGLSSDNLETLDSHLLNSAVTSGAKHRPLVVDKVAIENGRPVLYGAGIRLMEADLLVGAFGVNSFKAPVFEGGDFSNSSPTTIKAAISEITLDPEEIQRRFGNSVHLFMLPDMFIEFAAIIPKHSYVTLCILGKQLDINKMEKFLYHPSVSKLFPESRLDWLGCHCLPMMNVGALSTPYADRIVMVGDSGSTKLYKDGIGAAYFMGKSAAMTVLMHGVAKENFKKHYMHDYQHLARDNLYGRFLFFGTELFRDSRLLTSAMIDVVKKEQEKYSPRRKRLSSILWDLFTGNERYRSVFWRAVNPRLMLRLTKAVRLQLLRRVIHG